MKLEKTDLRADFAGANQNFEEIITLARESLAYDYSGNIEEAISACADSNTPIYYKDLYSNVGFLADDIQEYVNEDLIIIEAKNFDLSKLIQEGFYWFIEQDLNANLPDIIYNHAIKYANSTDYIKAANDENEIAEFIEQFNELVAKVADNYYKYSFDDVDDEINALIEELTNVKSEEDE